MRKDEYYNKNNAKKNDISFYFWGLSIICVNAASINLLFN